MRPPQAGGVSDPSSFYPVARLGAARVGVPPQVNVIGTIIFVVTVALMVANIVYQRRRSRQEAQPDQGAPLPWSRPA
jgi:ABC-type spermidine/putrescine transport system permease subunit II